MLIVDSERNGFLNLNLNDSFYVSIDEDTGDDGLPFYFISFVFSSSDFNFGCYNSYEKAHYKLETFIEYIRFSHCEDNSVFTF